MFTLRVIAPTIAVLASALPLAGKPAGLAEPAVAASRAKYEPKTKITVPPPERLEGFPAVSYPAPPGMVSSGPGAISFGPYVSVQVNVDPWGNNIVGDAANEPSIAIDPTNPNRMAIGWRQFNSVFSAFREAGWAYSTDRGATWTFPGVLTPGVFRSDPVLGFDAAGTFFYSSLTQDFAGFVVHVFKSTDGGATWSDPVYAYGGDKQWMVVDGRSGPVGAGNIYQFWNVQFSCCEPGDFTRSVDGAASFETTLPLPEPSMKWGTMDTGPDGVLYACGSDLAQRAHLFTRSLDALNPAATPTFSPVRVVDLGGASGGVSESPNPSGLLGQVWVTAHPTKPNHVYMLASVIRPGEDPLDVMFARSADGGELWSQPMRINTDPLGANWQWFGTLSVAPNGRLDAIWNQTPVNNHFYPTAVFYSFSLDEGQTWSEPVQVSYEFNSHFGFPAQAKIGDYYDMISDNGGANLAYAATFNEEQDVYFLRIPQDCNANGIEDDCDVACGEAGSRCDVPGCGLTLDCDANAVPDECDPEGDCDENGLRDICEIGPEPSLDCNTNRVLDRCEDLADCNGNESQDICDVFAADCNGNGVPDDCDVTSGESADHNGDTVPDECQGACCTCAGCDVRPEVECRLTGGDFSGFGVICGDANACTVPPAGDGECTSAKALPGVSHNIVPFDNRCVTSSELGALRCPDDPVQFGADLWYTYEAPCTGTVRISACERTDFDAVMAVYGGPTICTCELRDRLLACGDDTCGEGGGPPTLEVPVVAGRCYEIRLAGWEGARGQGLLQFAYLTACSSADLNGNGKADLADFAIFQRCFGRAELGSGCSAADLNDDGAVDLADYWLYFVSLP